MTKNSDLQPGDVCRFLGEEKIKLVVYKGAAENSMVQFYWYNAHIGEIKPISLPAACVVKITKS